MKKYFFLIIFLCVSTSTYAFPIAEGISGISTLIGVLSAVIVGVSPKLINNKQNSKKYLTLFIILLLMVTGLIAYIFVLNNKIYTSFENSIQSRPNLIHNYNHKHEIPSFLKLSDEQINSYLHNQNDLIIDIDEYYKNEKYKDFKVVQITGNEEGFLKLSDYAHNKSLFFFKRNEIQSLEILTEIVKSDPNANIILFSVSILESIGVSQKIFEKTGIKLPFVKNFNKEEAKHDLLEKKLIDIPNVFNEDIIEIRSKYEVRETHTLINAHQMSIDDFYMMTDREIKDYLSKFKKPIFVSYYENEYYSLENRLNKIENIDIDYYYLKGGLKKHFENGGNITPSYFNMDRLIDPLPIMKQYAIDDKVKFICVEKEQCLDNIPRKDTFFFSFRNTDKKIIEQEIYNLPKDFKYVLIANNQETYGNAMYTGYYLNKSGKNVIGFMVLNDAFSLEYIRIFLIKDKNKSLDDYRKHIEQNTIFNVLKLANFLQYLVENFGIFNTFVGLGLICRLTIFYFQINIYKCYYEYDINSIKILLSTMIVISSLFACFYFLNETLLNHTVIAHNELQKLNESHIKYYIEIFFVLMLIYQTKITFFNKNYSFLIISSIIVLMFGLGYIGTLCLPILLFFTASEFVALVGQFFYYKKYKKLSFLQKKGVILKLFKTNIDLPEKWLLVNKFTKTNGVLLKLDVFEIDTIEKYINLKKYNKWIVRSCSSNINENNLAGYYDSKISSSSKLKETIKTYVGKIDYVWVQPFVETKYSGCMQSFSGSVEYFSISKGGYAQATEGLKNTYFERVLRNKSKIKNNQFKKEFKMLRRIEKFFKSPVLIEYGLTKSNKVVIFQIRLAKKEERKLLQLENAHLANMICVKNNYLSGSILEVISNNKFSFYNGYLYINKYHFRYKIYTKEKSLYETNNILNVQIEELKHIKEYNLLKINNKIIYLLKIYYNIYMFSQSIIHKKNIFSSIIDMEISEKFGNEFNIIGDWIVNKNVTQTSQLYSYRDINHFLIKKINYILSVYLKQYGKLLNIDIELLKDYTIEELLSEDCKCSNKTYDKTSLFESNIDNSIIVNGDFDGELFFLNTRITIEEQISLLDKNRKYILVAEEIPSGIVKHLYLFSGLISKYGNELSHVALSAKQMNIPYKIMNSLPKRNSDLK